MKEEDICPGNIIQCDVLASNCIFTILSITPKKKFINTQYLSGNKGRMFYNHILNNLVPGDNNLLYHCKYKKIKK